MDALKFLYVGLLASLSGNRQYSLQTSLQQYSFTAPIPFTESLSRFPEKKRIITCDTGNALSHLTDIASAALTDSRAYFFFYGAFRFLWVHK